MKGFNLATKAIKLWSKRKLSEVSKFSISSIGQNRELGNLRKGHFFFSNHMAKLMFFSYRSFFWFWVPYTTKHLSNMKLSELSEISQFSILSIGQNPKLGNLGNCFVLFCFCVCVCVFFLFFLNHTVTL